MVDKKSLTRADMDLDDSGFDDFSGVIIDAWFGYASEVSPEYKEKLASESDPVMLIAKVDADGFKEPPKLGAYSCGGQEKWEVTRNGKEISPQKGNPVFHKRSNAGAFVAEIFKVAGGGDIGKGQDILAARGFRMTQAEFYIGLDSRWLRQDIPNPVDSSKTLHLQVATDYLNISEVSGRESRNGGGASTAASDEMVDLIAEMSIGKSEKELRSAILKESRTEGSPFKGNQGLLNQVFNEGLLKKLLSSGKLVEGEGGKYA